jgi:DtxR family Mn-dependent transcriptional regulator
MTAKHGEITASMEDYLETILQLTGEQPVARSKDIAQRLGVGMSSVSGALHTLKKGGLVDHEPYGYVILTKRGTRIAQRIVKRHNAWRDFLTNVLGIDKEEAEKTACQLEHGVSTNVTDRLIEFVEANGAARERRGTKTGLSRRERKEGHDKKH